MSVVRWIVYATRMIDYKLIGWRWRFVRPPRPNGIQYREPWR